MSMALFSLANPPHQRHSGSAAGLWFAVVLGVAVQLGGCDRSCSRLADKLCEQASMSGDKNAEENCESWKARTKRVSKESCQAALKHLELQR